MRYRLALVVLGVLSMVGATFAPAHADESPTIGFTSLRPKRAATYAAQAVPTPAFPLSSTFALHSRPGSQRVIYLDFNGHYLRGTGWNDEFAGGADVSLGAYDFDGNPAAFSSAEHAVIQAVWQRVAEDFAPLKVDVTTQNPGLAAIDRSAPDDVYFGSHAVISNTSFIQSDCGCAGAGWVGVFGAPAPYHQYFQPALVFGGVLGSYDKDIADSVSHEVGHNLGLEHDGFASQDYYAGHNGWAPIMGAGYDQPITQWSKGEYAGALNPEDDFSVMRQNGLSPRADDHGNAFATATSLATKKTGVIHNDADVDVFSFTTPGGVASWTASPAVRGPNLDIQLDLVDSAGNVLASNDPPSARLTYDKASGLSAAVEVSLGPGTYALRVQGVGSGSAYSGGYSGYGSLGNYKISGVASLPAPPTLSVSDVEVTETAAGTAANFTVALSKHASAPVSFDFATSAGTATAGVDFAPTSGQFTIPMGQLVRTVSVPIPADTEEEIAESFALGISNPSNATIGDGDGAATIVDDDTFGFAITNVIKTEGALGFTTQFSFTVSLNAPAAVETAVIAVTADGTATSASDYTFKSRYLVFAPGETSKTFIVVVKGDGTAEANERFFVDLTNPENGASLNDAQGVGTIRNDD